MALTLMLTPGVTWANEPEGGPETDPSPVVATFSEPVESESTVESEKVEASEPEPGSTTTEAGGVPSAETESAYSEPGDALAAADEPRARDGGITPFAGAHSPVCEAGYVYGISDDYGQIQQIDPNGTRSTIGQPVSQRPTTSPNGYNGLGIGADGSSVYAYLREGGIAANKATVYRFDTTSGLWAAGASVTAGTGPNGGGGSVQFVAGAVNLQTGTYMFGGFGNSNGKTVFRIWEYNPATNSIGFKGFVEVSSTTAETSNGDMAFDRDGNLFIVRNFGNSSDPNSNKSTTVTSITTTDLAAANGSTSTPLPSFSSVPVDTIAGVNGIAFDSNGHAYLSNRTHVYRYNMANWSNGAQYSNKLDDSTDLATCTSPPTITIEKEILGGRAQSGDQFQLTLNQGNTLIGNVTTEGSNPGLQSKRIGPMPITRGVTVSFIEAKAGSTVLDQYVSRWRCEVDGDPIPGAAASGTSGTVTIPATGQAVKCTFTNAPRATVKVDKKWVVNGTTYNHGSQPEGLGADLILDPKGTPQGTNPAWGQARQGYAQGDDVTIGENAEVTKDGCSLTSSTISGDGIAAGTELGEDGVSVTLPGRDNQYTVTNTVTCQSLTLVKQVDNSHGGNLVATDWNGGLFAKAGNTELTYDSGETKGVEPGSYVLSEDEKDGYELDDLSCQGGTLTGDTLEVGPGDTVTCTFVNKDLPGSVVWEKVDQQTPAQLLPGSEWKLTGPAGQNSQEVAITDCVANADQDCTGPDMDSEAGKFRLEGLTWGEYTLEETKAPPGYKPTGDKYTFTIDATDLTADIGPIENEQRQGPPLPLTGGIGRDHIYLAGAFALLLSMAAYGTARVRGRRNPHGA